MPNVEGQRFALNAVQENQQPVVTRSGKLRSKIDDQ
jgi:hypothetical protein